MAADSTSISPISGYCDCVMNNTSEIKTVLKHSSGKVRIGFVRSIIGSVMRITWAPGGSEGVDISESTLRSPMGNWAVIE
jgi:hypothetical protein